MAKYIDTDTAYEVLTKYYHHKTEAQHKALREALDRVPAADVQEVVRCKNCKWLRKAYTWNCEECNVCGIEPYETKREENDFCSRGEMNAPDEYAEPEINPCRGCNDYDGKGGCTSNGKCADKGTNT